MQTPIITDETLSQMSLMRLTSYILSLLAEALPHVANVETAEANAQSSAELAVGVVTGFDAYVTEKTTAFDTHVTEKIAAADTQIQSSVDAAVTSGVANATEHINAAAASASTVAVTEVDNAVENGLYRINDAVTTVLNTEV